jgi:hypothetical protein
VEKKSIDLTGSFEWKVGEPILQSVAIEEDMNKRSKKSRGPQAKMEVNSNNCVVVVVVV